MTEQRRRHGQGRSAWPLMLALVVAGACLAAPAPAASVSKTFFGVAPQVPATDADFERMRKGKVDATRLYVSWPAVDGAAPVGGFNWSTVDPVVAAAARQRIRILPFLYGTPDWVARSLDDENCISCVNYAPRSPQALAAWEAFAGAAVERYGPNGTFWAENPSIPAKPIRMWQIWSEQNSSTYYKPRPNPKAYAKLLDASTRAIKSRDRKADVVLGGMAGLKGSGEAMTASRFLRKLYKQKGAKKDFDGIAPHPYGAKLRKVKQQVSKLRREMRKARDGRADMWVTELGWSSSNGSNPLEQGKRGQAKRLKEAYGYFRSQARKLNVKTVIWYSWKDSANPLCDWCANSGLMKENMRPKPAWRAFTKFTGGK